MTLIPQFIEPRRGSTFMQSIALGSIQIAISLAVNALIVLSAGSIETFLESRPTWAKLQRRVTGTMLASVAIVLAREVPARANVP
jgi:threonine/homoserine/homoserine lactone efflux protein